MGNRVSSVSWVRVRVSDQAISVAVPPFVLSAWVGRMNHESDECAHWNHSPGEYD